MRCEARFAWVEVESVTFCLQLAHAMLPIISAAPSPHAKGGFHADERVTAAAAASFNQEVMSQHQVWGVRCEVWGVRCEV